MNARRPRRIRLRFAAACAGDDGVALLMSLFLMLIVSTLAVSLLAVVLNETKPTQLQRKTVRTIDAAEAGLQVTLNQLRAANNGAIGALNKLPCYANVASYKFGGQQSGLADGAVFTGTVGPSPGGLSYTADVSYYSQDPSNQSAAWLSSNEMSCPLTSVPGYAFVQSAGRGTGVPGLQTTTGDRSVHGTYQFQTTNVNIVGGRILEFGTTLCLDAGSNPRLGSTMTMQPCLALGTPRQLWGYRTDLTIYYLGSAALNLCIQAPPTVGAIPTLQYCSTASNTPAQATYPYNSTSPNLALKTPPQQQEWGFNDYGHFASVANDGDLTSANTESTKPGTCLQPQGADDGTQALANAQLIVASCGGATTGYTAWNPDPQVGAGKAGTNTTGLPGLPTYQFVNYFEFGRCLDITGQNYAANAYLIDYPCKQAPDSTRLTPNQVWSFSGATGGTGTMSVTNAGTAYCLIAPLTGNLAITRPCSDGTYTTAQKTWKATGVLDGNYAGSYQFVSSDNRCLSVDPADPTFYGSSKIIVESCDGSSKQKWNAPASPRSTNIANLNEDQGNNG